MTKLCARSCSSLNECTKPPNTHGGDSDVIEDHNITKPCGQSCSLMNECAKPPTTCGDGGELVRITCGGAYNACKHLVFRIILYYTPFTYIKLLGHNG